MILLHPSGKWIWITPDPMGVHLVTLPMGTEDRPCTGRVLAVGPKCEAAESGQRILFQKHVTQEITVDGTKLVLIHEDFVLGVLSSADEKGTP